MDRKDLAGAFEAVAVLLELRGDNPFKIKAYQQAARAVLSWEGSLADLAQPGVVKIKGIGSSLATQLAELVTTGRLTYRDELEASFPEGLLDLLKVPGLGPKKVKVLHQELGIKTLGELEYACQENRLITLKGFGAKSQAAVLAGIQILKKYRGRFLWSEIEPAALELKKAIEACPAATRVELAGSFRRGREVVKDLDLVVATTTPDLVRDYLSAAPNIEGSISGGEAKLTFRLAAGPAVDVRLVPPSTFPFAWHHLTGSQEHNVQMRRRAKERGLRLNEAGLFDESGTTPVVEDETALFALLDLAYIPPELREGRGEIEAASAGRLPELVRAGDIRGIFHVHSTFSDGALSVAELVEGARALGFEYLGLSDHSVSAGYAGGLDPDDLERQMAAVEKARAEHPDFGLFWGIESDIRPDGSLDYPDEVLARFDFVIASVHSAFHLPEAEMTKRLIAAVSNPFTTILGHPTGRLLLAREPYALDLPAVLAAAADHGVAIEINANPHRLDLDWREMDRAKALGLMLVVCPDAHSAQGLTHVRYGLMTARKGGLTQAHILNCLDRAEVAAYLTTRKKERAGA